MVLLFLTGRCYGVIILQLITLSLSPSQTHNEAGLPTALVRYHSCRVNVPLTVFTCTVVQAVGKYYAIGTSHGLILVFGECVCVAVLY